MKIKKMPIADGGSSYKTPVYFELGNGGGQPLYHTSRVLGSGGAPSNRSNYKARFAEIEGDETIGTNPDICNMNK